MDNLDTQINEIIERKDEPAPLADMPDAYATEEPKRKEYHADEEGLRKAAADLDKARESKPETVERTYVTYGGEDAGKPRPANETISLERASDDLTRVRGFETAEVQKSLDTATALEADALRSGQTTEQIVDAILQQQTTQQTPQQPDQKQIQPQPQSEPQIDPEIVDALQKSPKLRAALEQTAAQVQQFQQGAEQARQQYAQATHAATQAAIHSMIAAFPEFHGLTVEQMPAALQVLKANSPQRHAEAVQHLSRVDQLGRAAVESGPWIMSGR
jgi:hypothetical protein